MLRPDPPLASRALELAELDRPRFGRLGRHVPRAGTRPSQPRLDDLTGLRNTRALREELDERAKAGAAGVPLAIVVVDFDRLGALNLRYDRSVGDAVLWGGASVARDEAPSPRLVFRYDDDDLVLLVPGDEEDGREVAERIRERIAARNRDLPAVTVSCGVAAAETPAHAWRALESACASLRTAKRAGGNRVAIGTHRKGNGNGNGNGPSGGMDTALRAALALAVTTLEVRNPETADHSDDVVTLAETIGRRFGMGDYELDRLTAGAQLHDVGKLAIPTEILNKPGPLNKNEWAVIREHTVIGERILRSVPEMAEIATIVRHSHEHFDGSGYPDGLAGEEIPLASRIILCADAFHAMRSDRSYRRGRPTKDAIAELVACSGSQFDPRVVEEMIAIARDVRTARGVGRAGRRRIRRLAALLAALAVGGGSAYAASDDVRWIVDGVFDVMVPNVIAQQSGGSGATGGLTASPVEAVSRIVPVEFKATADSVDLTRTGVSADRSVEPQVSDEPSIAPERPAPAKPEPPASVPEPVDEAFEPLVPIASPLPSVDEPHVTSEAPVGPAPLEVVAVPESLPPLVDLAPAAEPAPELAPTAELASKPAPAAAATPAAVGNPRREPPGLVKLPVLDDTPPADDDARPQPPAVGNPHGEPPALGNPHEEPPAVGSPLEELPELGEPPAVGNPHGEPPALGNPHGEPPGLVRLPELDPPPSLEPLPKLEHGDPPAVGNPHGEPPAVGNPHVEDPPGLSVVEGTPILGDLSTAPPATGNPHDEPPAVGNPHEEPPAVGNPHDDDPPADDDEGGDPPAVGNPHDDPPAVGNPHGEPPAVGNPHVDPEPVLDAVSEPESVPTPPPGIPEHVLESHPVFGPGMELFTPAVTKPGKRRGQPTP